VQVKRAYKFRAYPTRPQEGRAVHLLADHCDLYNAALEERREAWRMRQARITYGTQSAQLKEIRRGDQDGQGRHSFTAQQQTLRRLNVVFAAFYKRAQEGRAGYPRFKSHSRFDQVMFVAGDGAGWQPAAGGRWARARFQAVGDVKVRQHRAIRGIVKTLQLKREHRRWYVIVVAESEPVPLPSTGREVGIDMGVTRFLTTSDGEIVANPEFLKVSADLIAGLQRRMMLIRQCNRIGVERLKTANMTGRPKPKPAPGQPGAFLANGAAAKAGLNKAVLDAGWAQFTHILAGKAEEAGRRVILVNPAGTSIGCHQCGARCTRPRRDTVVRPVHGPMDADVNGARNVYARAGLGSGQAAHAA